jgi:hypothetical protein
MDYFMLLVMEECGGPKLFETGDFCGDVRWNENDRFTD